MRYTKKWLQAVRKANAKWRGKKRGYSARRSATFKALWKTKAYRSKVCKGRSQEAKARWADPVYQKKQAKAKKQYSKKMKAWWKQHRKEMCKKRKLQAKKHRATYSAMMKKRWAHPDYKKKMCRIRKTQPQGNQIRHPKASFYRTMYEGANGKFWMRSSWEVAFAQWMDHCGIAWEYEKKRFSLGRGRHYTPDFYLPRQNEYVELKGWLTKRGKKKIEKFQSMYSDVKLYVFFGQHLKQAKIIPFRKVA